MEHSQIFSNVYIAFRVDQIYLVVANVRKLLSKTRKHTEQPPFWKLANTLSSHHFENLQTHKAATFWKLANTQSCHFLKTRKHTEQPLLTKCKKTCRGLKTLLLSWQQPLDRSCHVCRLQQTFERWDYLLSIHLNLRVFPIREIDEVVDASKRDQPMV